MTRASRSERLADTAKIWLERKSRSAYLNDKEMLKYEHNGVKPAQWCAAYLPTIVENDKADFLGGQLLTYGEDCLSLLL